MPKLKASGLRRSLFVDVGGERLPCIQKIYLKKMHYHNATVGMFKEDQEELELLQAVREKKTIVLVDDTEYQDDSGLFIRSKKRSYIAVYKVDNVHFEKGRGLSFDIVKRLLELA